jgi:hypothetical protein
MVGLQSLQEGLRPGIKGSSASPAIFEAGEAGEAGLGASRTLELHSVSVGHTKGAICVIACARLRKAGG